jgi:hypothetical protein
MSLEILHKWGGIAVCLISDCLFENDKEPFKTYTKKYPLPKLMFVSDYTGMQNINHHVDRDAVFGSVIVAMSDSGEQLTMWPGGNEDSTWPGQCQKLHSNKRVEQGQKRSSFSFWNST